MNKAKKFLDKEILRTQDNSVVKMQDYNQKLSKKIWDELVAIDFRYPESKGLLSKLLSAGAGWVLYDEIIDEINERDLPDEVVVDLVRALTYAYEGGSLDSDTYHMPKNIKDEKIQTLMLDQLQNPVGKETLLKVMDLLYFLEEGDNLDLLEQVINTNSHLLSDIEKLDYRLHYSSNNIERFSQIVNNLNSEENSQQEGYYNNVFYMGLMGYVGDGQNGLLKNEAAQTAVRTYLDENPVYTQGSSKIPDMGEYGNWLRASTAASGVEHLDESFYEQAVQTEDPIKTIAIIDYYANGVEEGNSPEVFNELINSEEIKQKLATVLQNSDVNENVKEEVKSTLKAYFEKKEGDSTDPEEPLELTEAVLTMTENQKIKMKKNLEVALENPYLPKKEKAAIKQALRELF